MRGKNLNKNYQKIIYDLFKWAIKLLILVGEKKITSREHYKT
jgi:hypothetical protein